MNAAAPVDVLALLSDPHYDLRPAADFAEARAAVAELVEAAHAIADEGCISASRIKNLRAALSKFGGAA